MKARTPNSPPATGSTPSFTASRLAPRRPLESPTPTRAMSHRSIIVLPDDTGKPIIDAISAAKKSLRIKMFVFSDPDLLAADTAAKGRVAKIHVMLKPARRSGEKENADTREALEKAGIEVKDSNPDFG